MKPNKIWYRKIDGGYELVRPYAIETGIKIPSPVRIRGYADLTADGFLLMQPRYYWDGASWSPDLKTVIRASGVHDVFAQMMRLGLISRDLWPKVNLLFRDICIDAGMFRVVAQLYYLGVCTPIAYRCTAPNGPEPALTEIGAP